MARRKGKRKAPARTRSTSKSKPSASKRGSPNSHASKEGGQKRGPTRESATKPVVSSLPASAPTSSTASLTPPPLSSFKPQIRIDRGIAMAVLGGLVAALAFRGLNAWVIRTIGLAPQFRFMGLGIAVAFMSLGMLLPLMARRRFQVGANQPDGASGDSAGSLHLLLCSVLCFIVGAAAWVAGDWLEYLGQTHDRILQSYFLAPVLTVGVNLLTVVAAGAPLFLVLGLLLRSVVQLDTPPKSSAARVRLLGAAGVGLGCGMLLVAAVGMEWGPGQSFRGAAALLLLMAIWAAVGRTTPGDSQDSHADDGPALRSRWRLALGGAAFAGTVSSGACAALWVHVVAVARAERGGIEVPAGLLAIGLSGGLLYAARLATNKLQSVRFVANRLAGAGLASALGLLIFSYVLNNSVPAFRVTPGFWLLWALCAVIPLVAMMAAAGIAGQAVMIRSPDPIAAGGRLMAGGVAALGAGLGLGPTIVLSGLGSYAGLGAGAMGALAAGGALLIHDPSPEHHDCRIRVGIVLGSALALTALLPAAGYGWLQTGSDRAARMVETWTRAYAVSTDVDDGDVLISPLDQSSDLEPQWDTLVCWTRLPVGARVAVAGWLPVEQSVRHAGFEPSSYCFSDDLWENTRRAPAADQSPEPLSACRLQGGVPRYDLVLVDFRNGPRDCGIPDVWRRWAQRYQRAKRPEGLAAFLVEADDGLIRILQDDGMAAGDGWAVAAVGPVDDEGETTWLVVRAEQTRLPQLRSWLNAKLTPLRAEAIASLAAARQ